MMTRSSGSSSWWRRIGAALLVLFTLSGSLSPAYAGETITFFHNDAAGSPMLATDVNGMQIWKETYRPYGEQLVDAAASQNNKIWFTGKPYDDSTGLSYMGARYYDPTLGRFMGMDPALVDPNDLHTFNRYAYANNNPYRFKDPNGEVAIPIVLGSGILLGLGCAVWERCRGAFNKIDWKGIAGALVYDPVLMRAIQREEAAARADQALSEPNKVFSNQQPPAGSKPISETPWSGDHGEIKAAVGAGAKDNVKISPDGKVWVQNPDGSWTDHGDVENLTGSGTASGEKGKDRDSEREKQRQRGREKRGWSDRAR